MKSKIPKGNGDYRQLQTKLFARTISMVFGSIVTIWFLYTAILRGNFANWMVALFQHVFRMDYINALNLYRQTFRNYMEIVFFIAIAIVFFLIFHFYLKWFTGYFGEINKGIDALIKENTDEISLSPELAATEKKINTIKHTLEKRKIDTQLAEKRKNDLVVYLAHDLKTPLTSIIGYLTLLRDEDKISEELRQKYLGISLDKAERLEDLINEFFEITRFNLSDITLQYSKVNLTRLLEQLVFEFKPMLLDKDLKCNLSSEHNLMLVCDVDKMQRVLDNLLRNAVFYSFENSTIEINVIQDENKTTIKFINHGNTIPKEKLERIFEQFYRLDTSRGSNNGGAGLGLAIAKEIVNLHNGTIAAKSKNEVIEFDVTIPSP